MNEGGGGVWKGGGGVQATHVREVVQAGYIVRRRGRGHESVMRVAEEKVEALGYRQKGVFW